MALPINIDDCRIEWHRWGGGKSLLRVTHIPSGIAVERQANLRDDWKLDDAISEIERRLQTG